MRNSLIDSSALNKASRDLRYIAGLARGVLALADKLGEQATIEKHLEDATKKLDTLRAAEGEIEHRLAGVDAEIAERLAAADVKAAHTKREAEALRAAAEEAKRQADQMRAEAQAEAARVVAHAQAQAREAVAAEVEAIKRKLG